MHFIADAYTVFVFSINYFSSFFFFFFFFLPLPLLRTVVCLSLLACFPDNYETITKKSLDERTEEVLSCHRHSSHLTKLIWREKRAKKKNRWLDRLNLESDDQLENIEKKIAHSPVKCQATYLTKLNSDIDRAWNGHGTCDMYMRQIHTNTNIQSIHISRSRRNEYFNFLGKCHHSMLSLKTKERKKWKKHHNNNTSTSCIAD